MQTTTQTKATLVAEENRLNILPGYLGKHMLMGEKLVYAYMEKLTEGEYRGGYWDFYETPEDENGNRAFFMVPKTDLDHYEIIWEGNGYEGDMSPEAAGITACLFAFNHVANMTEDDQAIELFYALRNFAISHPEAEAIFAAID